MDKYETLHVFKGSPLFQSTNICLLGHFYFCGNHLHNKYEERSNGRKVEVFINFGLQIRIVCMFLLIISHYGMVFLNEYENVHRCVCVFLCTNIRVRICTSSCGVCMHVHMKGSNLAIHHSHI